MKRALILLGSLTVAAFMLTQPVMAQEFPLTIEHKFGTTVLEEQPERVASIDYGGIGNLLAVGVSPVTVRQWRPMDGFRFTTPPWAEHLLTTEPVVLEGALDFEAISATNPDVIIALYSGIDAADYERLSLIAPVIAVPAGVGDYNLSWDERARFAARAVGKEAEAEQQIEAISNLLLDIAKDNPQWKGMTAVLGGYRSDGPFAYTPDDVRAQFLYEMGFQPTRRLEEMAQDGAFNISLSAEQIDVIDADIVVHYVTDEQIEPSLDEPTRRFLKAYETGGEIFLGDLPVAALARVSLLSIPFALESMVPMLAAAADREPETVVPDARIKQ